MAEVINHSQAGVSLNILLIHLEGDAQGNLLSTLATRGHNVVAATAQHEARQYLAGGNIDVVFVDLEFIRRADAGPEELWGWSGENHPTVIGLRADDLPVGGISGLDGYLRKPVEADALLAALEEHVISPRLQSRYAGMARQTEEVIDVEEVLERVDGDVELLGELVELFMETTPDLFEEIEHAVRENNLEELARHAHTIKGAVGNLGAKPAYDMAMEMESRCKSGDLAGVNETFGRLKSEIAQIEPAFEEIARKHGS